MSSSFTINDFVVSAYSNHTQIHTEKERDEGFDFRRMMAFRGLKIIDVVEKDGHILFKCKRGNKIFVIDTDAASVEIHDSTEQSIFHFDRLNEWWKNTCTTSTTNDVENTSSWVMLSSGEITKC